MKGKQTITAILELYHWSTDEKEKKWSFFSVISVFWSSEYLKLHTHKSYPFVLINLSIRQRKKKEIGREKVISLELGKTKMDLKIF